MNEDQVTLQAIQQFVEQHAQRADIERFAKSFRDLVAEYGDSARLAICLVGAEMAAEPDPNSSVRA